MSTAHPSSPPPSPPPTPQVAEVKVYSHSPLFYWWPVWAVGFIMFAWTYIDGGRMYVFQDNWYSVFGESANLKARRDLRVETSTEKGTELKQREGVIYVTDKYHLPPSDPNSDGTLKEPEQPTIHMAQSRNPGVLFALTLILIILISNVPLRGLWSIIVIIGIVLMAVVFALLGWWVYIFEVVPLLRIHINAAGYMAIGLALAILWAGTFFVFDRRTYMIFTAGQVRAKMEIGEGEKVYDTTGLVFEKKQNDFFRHWVVGLGAGDLIVKTGGTHSEMFDLPNVLFVSHKVRQIEQLLKSREVV